MIGLIIEINGQSEESSSSVGSTKLVLTKDA